MRAVLFSLVSIFIIILFTSVLELQTNFEVRETQLEVTRTRVKILNQMVQDMENVYFDRMIAVSAKNALIGLAKLYDSGNCPTYCQLSLWRAMNYTMYDGVLAISNQHNNPSMIRDLKTDACNNQPCMDPERTITGMLSELREQYQPLGMDLKNLTVELDGNGIRLKDPRTIQVTATIHYDFADKSSIAAWTGKTERTVEFSVYGIRDPYENDMITSDWHENTLADPCGHANIYAQLGGTPTSPPNAMSMQALCP